MDLSPYVEELRQQLMVAAEAGGEDARALADRLSAQLESATRLVLLDALSAAADEITRDLAPGSVDVRLRRRDPEFVVTSAAVGRFVDERTVDERTVDERTEADADIPPGGRGAPAGDTDDGGTSRITLRLSQQMKARVEEAAGQEGLSVNSWLVRAVAAALEPQDRDRRARRRGPSVGQHFTGWAR